MVENYSDTLFEKVKINLWINSMRFYAVCFYYMSKSSTTKIF